MTIKKKKKEYVYTFDIQTSLLCFDLLKYKKL